MPVWTPTRTLTIGLLAALLPMAALAENPEPKAAASAPLFDQDGYRVDRFLAPVPASVPGAKTLTTGALQSLLKSGNTVLIDVLPTPPRPANLAAETLWMPPPHQSIAGAVWLPNVGYGHLSEEQSRYLQDNLSRLSGDSKRKPMVFFCKPDCWMSWNAAKRAAALGYSAVHWYPDGVAGWEAAKLPLAIVEPVSTN